MREPTLYDLLKKWLKTAKLRDGSHKVGFTADGSFFYRGFSLAWIVEDVNHSYGVRLKWPARVHNKSPWALEDLSMADPRFFQDLRKALRSGMTTINEVAINPDKVLRQIARAKQ